LNLALFKNSSRFQTFALGHFASFLSGGFTPIPVINPHEKKLAKHNSAVCWFEKLTALDFI
jgi:hypothetical protein